MKFFLTMFFLIEVLNGYEVSDRFLGLHGVVKGEAYFEIESSVDFKGCPLKLNIHKANRFKFSKYCRFKKDTKGNVLACTEDLERCMKKSHIVRTAIQVLNNFGIWHVSGVASNDTLSVRAGAGSKYRKVYALPHNARNIKVLSVTNNGSTTWYKIRYRGVSGWVSSKYLNYSER